ncbi:hypothetical protein [Taibaiella koreensis]|uniref:hypothetical protein n=1 Tax=Taibaiella koreensis TaxID=1268548 RepID=UPI000E59E88C|nr:hypothetical protein [Taibaiella koreensis]
MERVKNVLQRLQEVYQGRHQKSAIDVDLMLDYTRVMYADLLEWRKTFGEAPPTDEKATPNETVTAQSKAPEDKPAAQQQEAKAPTVEPEAKAEEAPAIAATIEDQPVASAQATITPEDEELPKDEEPPKGEEQPKDKAYQPVVHDEPAPKPAPEPEAEPVVRKEPEKEYLNALQKDASGISFEPPSAPDVRNEIKEELLVAEPTVNVQVEEIPAPPPAAIPLPDAPPQKDTRSTVPQASLFHAEKAPRDIRSVIGINDKYLFLNELFGNHKSNYEETLDQLNQFATGQQAEDWIRTKVAPAHKWDKEDATVDSFYTLVRRHFSER